MKKAFAFLLVFILILTFVISVGSVAMASVSIDTNITISTTTLSGEGTIGVTVSIRNNGDPVSNVQLQYPTPPGNVIPLGDMATGEVKEHVNNSWIITDDMLDKPMNFNVIYTTDDGEEHVGATESFTINRQEAIIRMAGSAMVDQQEVEKGGKANFTFTFRNDGNTTVDSAYLTASPILDGNQIGDTFSLAPNGVKEMNYAITIDKDYDVSPVLTYSVLGQQYVLTLDTVSVKMKEPEKSSMTATLKTNTTQVTAGEKVTFDIAVANTGTATIEDLTAKDSAGNVVNLSTTTLEAGEETTGSVTANLSKTGNYAFTITGMDPSGNPISIQSNAIAINVAAAETTPTPDETPAEEQPEEQEELDPYKILKMDASLSTIELEKPGNVTVLITVTNLSDQGLQSLSVYEEETDTVIGAQPTLGGGNSYEFEKEIEIDNSTTLVIVATALTQDGEQVEIQMEPVPIKVLNPDARGVSDINLLLLLIVIAIVVVAVILIVYLAKNRKKQVDAGKPASLQNTSSSPRAVLPNESQPTERRAAGRSQPNNGPKFGDRNKF